MFGGGRGAQGGFAEAEAEEAGYGPLTAAYQRARARVFGPDEDGHDYTLASAPIPAPAWAAGGFSCGFSSREHARAPPPKAAPGAPLVLPTSTRPAVLSPRRVTVMPAPARPPTDRLLQRAASARAVGDGIDARISVDERATRACRLATAKMERRLYPAAKAPPASVLAARYYGNESSRRGAGEGAGGDVRALKERQDYLIRQATFGARRGVDDVQE
jgi:hypothetical protein